MAKSTKTTGNQTKITKVKPTTKSQSETKVKAPRTPKVEHLFQGKVEATRVFKRKLDAYTNCIAYAWMLLNDHTGKVTYGNSFGQSEDSQSPRSSWNPDTYTFSIKEKLIAKKMEEYQEVEDREEWPTFVTFAVKPAAVKASTVKPTAKESATKKQPKKLNAQ
jgi:hypothetical protein